MTRVLVVDDEPGVRFAVAEVLAARGHEVTSAESGERALELSAGSDLVVTDLMMPGMSGLELLRELRARDPSLPVIVLTARGSERAAVEAMKAGAQDYLTKPFDIDELGLAVERGIETRRLRHVAQLHRAERGLGGSVIGESPKMRALLELLARLAEREVSVLVRGETGTGKELVGGLLHALGPRAQRPLVRFNCAAIPEQLAEAELFGHTRGAFTGAGAARRGYFSEAAGGTLVLDEVGELSPALQPKILRALQEGEIQPVGAGRPERVDVRVVACTNRDLAAAVQSGRFRADLYYRLCVVEIVVPPLRERREDIAPLAEEFVRRYATRFGLDDVKLGADLVRELERRDWPGNVRELENTVARLVALSRGGEIPAAALEAGDTQETVQAATLREKVASFERDLLTRALEQSGGNQSAAARVLGVSRVTLIDKLKRYGLLGNR